MEHKKNMLVIGIGGAGLNIVNRMVAANLEGVNYLVMDTDEDDLRKATVSSKIQLQPEFSHKVDADLTVSVGRLAILNSKDDIGNQIKSADAVFIIAGMGGECGNGGAVELARIAKERSVPTTAVAIAPFKFEGKSRMTVAEEGISYLQQYADKVIILHNEELKYRIEGKLTFANAFSMVDEVVTVEIQKAIQEYAESTT